MPVCTCERYASCHESAEGIERFSCSIAPGDYTRVSDEVTFGADETVKVVEVPIQQDNVVEGVELFTATLSPVSGSIGVQIGGQGEATATITDDDSESCKPVRRRLCFGLVCEILTRFRLVCEI